MSDDGARLRLTLPFASKGDISLKKLGLELIVGVDGQQADHHAAPRAGGIAPTGATFEDGALEVQIQWSRRAARA